MADDFSSSAPDLWISLEPLTSVRRYEPHSVLFEQGHMAEGIYMIQKGQVRVWMPERSAQTVIATPVTAGTMLGLSEAISDGTHKLSAMAIVQTEAGFVPRDALMAFLRDHHDLCLQVVKILSEDLHSLYHTFHRLSVGSPRGRRPQHGEGIQ